MLPKFVSEDAATVNELRKRGTSREGAPAMKPETPFPRHWLYYILLKYGVLIAALGITLYTIYRLV